jgi:cystathionine beta-synthase
MMHKAIYHAIGNTPIIGVPITSGRLYAKLEYLNPGGSVKDRSALYMIEYAEKHGQLKPGGTIIDASSGNQGIAMAMIGAAKGYTVIICVSEKISQEKLQTLRAYGAQVHIFPVTATLNHPESYHAHAVRLQQQIPNSFMPNQYYNILNAQAHYTLLGPEIWQQTEGHITHLFAAAGTGGTVSGAGKFLKEQNPDIRVIAIDSINSYRATNGHPKPYHIEGMGVDFISPVYDETVIDEVLLVSDQQALSTLATLSHQHGLLVGPSSGAVCWAAINYAQNNFCSKDIGIMIFGDSGRAYLTRNYYALDQQENSLNLVKTDNSQQLLTT